MGVTTGGAFPRSYWPWRGQNSRLARIRRFSQLLGQKERATPPAVTIRGKSKADRVPSQADNVRRTPRFPRRSGPRHARRTPPRARIIAGPSWRRRYLRLPVSAAETLGLETGPASEGLIHPVYQPGARHATRGNTGILDDRLEPAGSGWWYARSN